jgi:hypothetical protein
MNGRNDAHSAAAVGAFENVNRKNPVHEFSPRAIAWPRLSRLPARKSRFRVGRARRVSRSSFHNPHSTEHRRVEYAWHRLHGQELVVVCGSRGGPAGPVFHCRLNSESPGSLCIQIPAWMFDRVRCSTTRLESLPRVSWAALLDLRQLLALGKPGGLLDAKDPLHEGPIRLITNPELSPNNLDGATHTAGVTFLGQFLDHDMTFDTTSRLGIPTRPERSPNRRTPSFDLDSVYGGGPTSSPELYDPSDRAKFRVEKGGQFEDLPRRSDGTAIIPAPRNDENLMIAGLQVAFLLFHNRVVDWLRDRGDDHRLAEADQFRNLELERLTDGGDSDRNRGVFEETRRLVHLALSVDHPE